MVDWVSNTQKLSWQLKDEQQKSSWLDFYNKMPWSPFVNTVAGGIGKGFQYMTSPHPQFQQQAPPSGTLPLARGTTQPPVSPFALPKAPEAPSGYNPWAYEPPEREMSRLYGATKKQVTDFWSEPEQVGLPETWNEMTETEKSEFVTRGMPDWYKQHYAGWGDQFEAASGVALRFGEDEIAAELMKIAEGKQSVVGAPQSRVQQLWRAIPATEAMMAMMVLTGGVGGMAGMVTGGTRGIIAGFPSAFVRALGPAALQSASESFLEAGVGYNEAIKNGLSEDAANEVFDRIAILNMLALTPINAAQMAIAFPGLIGRSRIVPTTVGIGIEMLSEGGQEVLQDVISRQALGQEVKWDGEMKDNFILGALLGGIFGGGGSAITIIQEKVTGTMPEYLREVYDTAYNTAIKEGVSEERAKMFALNAVAQDKGGSKWLEQKIKKLVKEERGSIGRVEETPEGAREPWQMTQEEYLLDRVKKLNPDETDANIKRIASGIPDSLRGKEHKASIEQAISEGQPVPANVLSEYPDLTAKPVPPTAVTPEVTPVAKVAPVKITKEAKLAQAEKTAKKEKLTSVQKIRRFYQDKIKSYAETKTDLANYVNEHLPKAVRGTFTKAIANVETDRQLGVQLGRVEVEAEKALQKTMRGKVLQSIKRFAVKKKGGFLKGKFTAAIQTEMTNTVNLITQNAKEDRQTIRLQSNAIRSSYLEGNVSYEDMLKATEDAELMGLNGMNSRELAAVTERVDALLDAGKVLRADERAVEDDITRGRVEGVVAVATGGRGLKQAPAAIPKEELYAEKGMISKAFHKLLYSNMGLSDFFDYLSKFDKSLPMQSKISQLERIYTKAREAEVKGEEVAQKTVVGALSEITGVTNQTELNKILNTWHTDKVTLGTFTDLDGAQVTLIKTKDQIMAKYQQLQDPTLDETFTKTMRYSEEMKDAIVKNLTKQEKAWADFIMSYYRTDYASINTVYREIFKTDMEYNPYHTPLDRDFGDNTPEINLLMDESAHYASTANGHLKARTNSVKFLRDIGATQALVRHIAMMEHFKSWSVPIRDLRRVFKNKEVQTAIAQYHDNKINGIINEYIERMARGGMEKRKVSKSLDYLRRTFQLSVLGAKPAIGLKQVGSVLAYSTEIPIGDYIGGVNDFWKHPIENYHFMIEHSSYLRDRFGKGYERDIRKVMDSGKWKQAISNKLPFFANTMFIVRAGDKFAVMQGSWSAYKYQQKLNAEITPEDGLLWASELTERTQPSHTIQSMTLLQSDSSFTRLFTMFQNQINKYFRIINNNARNFKYNRGSRAKATSNIILAWVILPAIFQLMADGFRWDKDHQMRSAALGPINDLLVVGQLANSIAGWLTDAPFDYTASPIFSTGKDLQWAINYTTKIIRAGGDPTKDIKTEDVVKMVEYYAQFVGKITGAPTPAAVQIERAIRDQDLRQIVFSRYALGMTAPKKTTTTTGPRKLKFAGGGGIATGRKLKFAK